MKKLKPLTPYRITKPNTDGSLEKDDAIYLAENGDLVCIGKGFMSPEDFTPEILDFEAKISKHYRIITKRYNEIFIKDN